MSYLLGVGLVALLQAGLSYALILATQGGGSFVGLGVMLLAAPGLPITALANFLLIREHRKRPGSPYVLRVLGVSLILPALQSALAILVSVFRL